MKTVVSTIIISLFLISFTYAQKTTARIGLHINRYEMAEGLEFGLNITDNFNLSIFQIVETEISNERPRLKSTYNGIITRFKLLRYKTFEWKAGIYAGIANKYFIAIIPETSLIYHLNNSLSFSLSGYFRENVLTLSPKLCIRF